MEHRASFDKSAVNLFAIMAMSCIWKMRSFHKTPDDDLLIVRFRFTSSLSPVQSGSSRYRLWYRNECVCTVLQKRREKWRKKGEFPMNILNNDWTCSLMRQTNFIQCVGWLCIPLNATRTENESMFSKRKSYLIFVLNSLCTLTFIHRIQEHTHTLANITSLEMK